MRVLYVNQTGAVSGAELSLLTLIDALDGRVEPLAACPEGALAGALRSRGVPVVKTTSTDASFRLHPVHTPRAVAELVAAGAQVAVAARRSRARVVHANTTRAGLIALVAHRFGAPLPLVHVRDWIPPGRLPRAVLGLVCRQAGAVIANSRWTARQIPAHRAPVHPLHNPVDLAAFDPANEDRARARGALGLSAADEAIGIIGQLTPWKGQADMVEVLALLRRTRPRARLLVVGSAKFSANATRYDNSGYARELSALPQRLGIGGAVSFLGERRDVPAILRAIDILVVPSWREAFGRVAAEGMLMGLPVVVTARGGTAEIVRDGIDGRVLAPRDPATWAGVLDELLGDPQLRRVMGARGRAHALESFAPAAYADAVIAVYEELLR